jgi:hypothetical protein
LICRADIQIPSGTKVSCRLEESISSATAEEGQPVTLTVTEEVKIDGVVVIPQGSQATGSVLTATAKRRMGRAGKLDFSIDKVRASDGEFVPVRYTVNKREGGSKAVSTGVITAGVAVLFWPAAPFVLLRKGKDVKINRGIILEVFTDQDHKIASASPVPAAVSASATTPAAKPAQQIDPVKPPTTAATPKPTGKTLEELAKLYSKPAEEAPAPTAVAIQAATPAPVVAPMKVQVAPVRLSISSDPTGAEITLDGKYLGSTPSQSLTPEGDHTIKVSKRGFVAWERTLTIKSGDSIAVNAELEKLPSFQPKISGLQ